MKTISVSSPQIKELIVKKIGRNFLWGLEKVISRYSLVPNTPFLSSKQFEWTHALETNWQAIREELDVILQYTEQLPRFQDISEDQGRNISKDDLWKTFFSMAMEYKWSKIANIVPKLLALLRKYLV